MAFLAAAAPYIAAASTVVSTASAIKQGADQKQQAEAQAITLRNQANADEAASQRAAITSRRQANYAISRGQALAAASGAGASDPTVVGLLGNIAGQGEYNALTQLYEGDTEGGNARSQSQAAINEGNAYQKAGYLKGVSTILTGATTLATKYK